ncbi:hypothetical protein CALCODRAFT_480861 [Calocera cornea HHB12733]|uniref:Glyoxalase/fosfomycin resistance/dioxygenase domain-containing protein n=1 Tax=Calocera cornea HHB12733 TaxID=1353952 RepID=A0A165IB49_9BASI|nr:hypothetical protein CALCODRAFT_480861 [Calocera cornea HHB12733]
MSTLVVYLPCNDVEATCKWYSDVLGFKSDPKMHYPGMFEHIYLDGPDARSSRTQFMLRSYPRAEKGETVPPGTKPPPQKLFFDITDKAKGKETVDERYQQIKARMESGLTVDLKDPPKDEVGAGYRSFELLDPNGHELAFFVWL